MTCVGRAEDKCSDNTQMKKSIPMYLTKSLTTCGMLASHSLSPECVPALCYEGYRPAHAVHI